MKNILFKGKSGHIDKIQVAEKQGKRYLLFGSTEQKETAYDLQDPDKSVFEYPKLMATGLALHPDTKNVLIIGLGGGYMPGMFQRHRPDISVTVVEIDPVVLRLAQDFFGFMPGGSVRVVIEDGRKFLEQNETLYDQIWLDAYDEIYIPKALTTAEFLQLCRKRLRPHGLVVQNIHTGNPLCVAHQATMTEVFGFFYWIGGIEDTNAALIAQKDAQVPTSVRGAFSKGFKRHGTRFGTISLKDSLANARIVQYSDPRAVLHDYDEDPDEG